MKRAGGPGWILGCEFWAVDFGWRISVWILVCGFWAVDFSVDFAMNFAVETYVDSGVEHDSEPCSSCASENLGGFWLWIFFKRKRFIKNPHRKFTSVFTPCPCQARQTVLGGCHGAFPREQLSRQSPQAHCRRTSLAGRVKGTQLHLSH